MLELEAGSFSASEISEVRANSDPCSPPFSMERFNAGATLATNARSGKVTRTAF